MNRIFASRILVSAQSLVASLITVTILLATSPQANADYQIVRTIGGPSVGQGNGQFWDPGGLSIDPSGNLWVADTENFRIQEFNGTGGYLRQIGTPAVAGSGNGQFNFPFDVATDSSGNAWVADSSNNRIQEISSTATYLGQFGNAGSGNGQFNNPSAVAADSSGNIWVADTGNHRIQEFTSARRVRSSIRDGRQRRWSVLAGCCSSCGLVGQCLGR